MVKLNLLCAGLTVCAFLSGPPFAAAKKIVFCVRPDAPVPEALSQAALKDLYIGAAADWSRERIVAVENREKKIFNAFLREVMGLSESAYKTLWLRKVFSDDALPPRQEKDADEIKHFLSRNKNAIGFLWEEDLLKSPARAASELRVVFEKEVRPAK